MIVILKITRILSIFITIISIPLSITGFGLIPLVISISMFIVAGEAINSITTNNKMSGKSAIYFYIISVLFGLMLGTIAPFLDSLSKGLATGNSFPDIIFILLGLIIGSLTISILIRIGTRIQKSGFDNKIDF